MKKYTVLTRLVVLISIVVGSLILPAQSWAVSCNAVFTGGVQSHDPNGKVHMEYETRIFGGGTVLQTPRLTMTHTWQDQRGMCHESLGDASVCTASGNSAEKSSPEILSHSYMPAAFITGTGDSVNLPYRDSRILSGQHYGAINVGQEAVLTLSGIEGDMTMTSLISGYQSVIEFSPGNYWIDGNVSLGATFLKRLGSQPGAVNLYVNGQFNAGHGVVFENFSDEQPFNVYAVGNIDFRHSSHTGWSIPGALYSQGRVDLGMGARVSQGVYAASINTAVNVHISYSALHQEHFLGGMRLNSSQVEVNFQPGDYYFSGDMDIGVAAIIRNMKGSDRPVRIFVDGSIALSHAVIFENFDDGKLLIYASGNINITSQNDVRAFIYAAGDVEISFSGNSRYIGAISGTNVTIGQSSVVQYVEPKDLGEMCVDDSAVAYYQLSHQSPALTCEAEVITVTAYDDNDQVMIPPSGTEVAFSMSPDNGSWVGGNTWIFSGTESAATRYLRNTTPGNFSLLVTDGVASGGSTIEFTDAALKFYGNPMALPSPMPSMVAGQGHIAALRAVQTNTDTGACEARVQGSQQVSIGFECRNPQSCVSGQVFSLAGSAAAPNNFEEAIDYASIHLHFDADGIAELPLLYTDVGQVRLHAQLPLPVSGNDPATVLVGSSSEFVVKPYQVVVSDIETLSGNANEGTTTSGSGFVAAGEAFKVNLEVQNAQGDITPNFGNELSPEQVSVDVAELVYPTGGSKGALSGNADFLPITGSPGRFSSSDLRWNNVGTLTLSAGILDGDYLGAGDVIRRAESEPVGRFYPYEFHLLSGQLINSCGSFSYMTEGSADAIGQPALRLSYRLEARGFNTGILSNYDEGLAYPVAERLYVAENADQGNGDDLQSRLVASPGSWSQGVLDVVNSVLQLQRDSGRIDGPFRQFQLGVQVEDMDGATLNESYLNMNAEHSGDCRVSHNCDAASLGDPVDIRYGRMFLAGGHGAETMNLPAVLATQYWDGAEWVKNSDDNCTVIAAANIYQNEVSLLANEQVAIGSGVTRGDFAVDSNDQVTFMAGEALSYFQAPGLGNTGSFTLKVDLSSYPWLQLDWNRDNMLDDEIRADINFGSYRGHDRIIYWREIFD